MKRTLLLCAFVAIALTAQPAKADPLDFTITFNGGPLGYSGSGIFIGSLSSPGVYTIDGVFSGSVTDPGFGTSAIVSVTDPATDPLGGDNLLFYPSSGGQYFDGSGLSFTLANGIDVNLFDFTAGPVLFESAIDTDPTGGVPEFVTESVVVTPEPSSIILLGTSAIVGAAGLFRRRRSLA